MACKAIYSHPSLCPPRSAAIVGGRSSAGVLLAFTISVSTCHVASRKRVPRVVALVLAVQRQAGPRCCRKTAEASRGRSPLLRCGVEQLHELEASVGGVCDFGQQDVAGPVLRSAGTRRRARCLSTDPVDL